MPVQYASITTEHHAVRRDIGLFDISHMGRLAITGPQAQSFLRRILTNDVDPLLPGQAAYSLVCNTLGGVLDDVLITRFDQNAPCRDYLLVVNASNREKILAWLETHRPGFDVAISDDTLRTGMIALQGPRSAAVLRSVTGFDLLTLKYFTATRMTLNGHPVVVSRTGYTGEDGCELILPSAATLAVWEQLVSAGATPCGLGARDTLRLEAAMPLYGHELSEAGDPLSAGLGFAVKLREPAFIGGEALAAIKAQGPKRKRIGMILAGRRIAREHLSVYSRERLIGEVTSGTFSPTLEKSIAMAFVDAEFAAPGTPVEVDIRGSREAATVVKLPFYKRG
jgi:aminomethyltransferase